MHVVTLQNMHGATFETITTTLCMSLWYTSVAHWGEPERAPHLSNNVPRDLYYGLAVASPYVGMARFQDGGSNQCISVFMAISSPENTKY